MASASGTKVSCAGVDTSRYFDTSVLCIDNNHNLIVGVTVLVQIDATLLGFPYEHHHFLTCGLQGQRVSATQWAAEWTLHCRVSKADVEQLARVDLKAVKDLIGYVRVAVQIDATVVTFVDK